MVFTLLSELPVNDWTEYSQGVSTSQYSIDVCSEVAAERVTEDHLAPLDCTSQLAYTLELA